MDSRFAWRYPRRNTLAPSQREISMATTVSYLRKGMRPVLPARLVTGAVVAALLFGTVLLTGCQPPPDDPKIIVVAASATANEPAPVLSDPDRAMLLNAGSASTR